MFSLFSRLLFLQLAVNKYYAAKSVLFFNIKNTAH